MVAMFETIREFGLERHDFPILVRNLSTILRWQTLNVDSRYKKRWLSINVIYGIPIIYYVIMLISLSSYIYAFQVSALWFIFFRDAEEESLKKLITLSQCVTSMVGATKFLNMYFNKNELMGIIDAYLICDSRVVPHSRMSKNINMTLRVVKKRAVILWLMVVSNLILYVVIRPLIVDRYAMKDYQLMWGLEPQVETPNYAITVFVITWTALFVVLGPIHITIFLIVVVGYSEAQMIALSKELLNLWEDVEADYHEHSSEIERLPNNRTAMLNEFLKRRLEDILKSHAINIQLIQQVETAFRNGIAFQLMVLSIALVADLLCGLENAYTQVPFTMLLVGMDCYTGQNLIDASKAFEAAVYRCQWEKFDTNNMKLVLMMLQSAQKTMKLSAGGVTSLDYPSFMYLVKSIYSVYTALRSKSEFD